MTTSRLSLLMLALLLANGAGHPQRQPRSATWMLQFDSPDEAEHGNEGLFISQSELPQDVLSLQPKITGFRIISDIHYRYAHTIVSSTMFNPDRISQEVHFSMVLPETAFISGFLIEVQDKIYEAYVHEKEMAKKEYEEAVQQGKSAGHVQLSARDSNRFTISVNIEPSSYMNFNLTYEELLMRKLSTYSHIINLDPGQIVNNLSVEINIQESANITTLHIPPILTSNEISTHPEGVSNPLAEVTYPTPKSVKVHWAPTVLQQKEFSPNGVRGQLIVQYDTSRTSIPGQLLINEDYFAHFFAPEHLEPLPKHVIFVLDVSGSMEGRKLMQLKEAMSKILDDLNEDDFFSLIIFSSYAHVWRDSSSSNIKNVTELSDEQKFVIPNRRDTIKKAKKVITRLKAEGGTNIHDAIKWAFTISEKSKTLWKQVQMSLESKSPETIIILLTDGEPTMGVTNLNQIISDTNMWNKEHRASMFSLALGEGADSEFLKKLSLRNSGFARKIYEATDTAVQLTNFYQQVASPLLANVSFIYDSDQVVPETITQNKFPSFYSGSELVIAGQLQVNYSRYDLLYEVVGESMNGFKHFEDDNPIIVLNAVDSKHGTETIEYINFLERLWAYLSIRQLIDQVETADGEQTELQQHALELALKYSFVTPFTSLVVVRPNGSKALTETQRADYSEPYNFGLTPLYDSNSYSDEVLSNANTISSRRGIPLLSSLILSCFYYIYNFLFI